MLCLLLDGRRRREGQKKERERNVRVVGMGFPRAGPALLAVRWVPAVRCSERLI
jgi:hypothetical protein